MTSSLRCAVMIPTHNRREELRRTLDVVAQLDPLPEEVIITADACTDGTEEFVRATYASHKLIVNVKARGSTASRDRMLREATSDLVLSIDDDSYPIESDAIARIRDIFTRRPRLAVASFPQRSDETPESLTQSDFGPAKFVGTYVNAACAFRRSAFVELGGHFGPFWNAYDEPDFAMRALSTAWEVRFEPEVIMRHHYSGVNRNHVRVHRMHARNELWSVMLRCPLPQLLGVALFRAVRQFGYAWQRGPSWWLGEPKWWLAFLAGLPRSFAERRTIPWSHYLAWMQLVREPIEDEAEWNQKFGSARS